MKYLIKTDVITEGGGIMRENSEVLADTEAEAIELQKKFITDAESLREEQYEIVRSNPQIYDAPSFSDIVYSMIIEIEEDVSTVDDANAWLDKIRNGEILHNPWKDEGGNDEEDEESLCPRELDSVRVFSCFYNGDRSSDAEDNCREYLS